MTEKELEITLTLKVYKMAYLFGKLYSGLMVLDNMDIVREPGPAISLIKTMHDELSSFIDSELFEINK